MNLICYRKPSELKPHPLNQAIYGDGDADPIEDLVESLRRQGILTPLLIAPDGTILSGHRRWRAARIVGLDALPCQVVDAPPEVAELLILESNQQRRKTFSQLMREDDHLRRLLEAQAHARRLANLRQYAATSSTSPDDANLHTRSVSGRTLEVAAETLGVKPRTLHKMRTIWQAAQSGDAAAQRLVEQLDAGKLAVDRAYKLLKQQQGSARREAVIQQAWKSAKPAFQLYHGDLLEAGAAIPDASVHAIITDPPYGKQYLPLYERLACLAERVLVEGGLCVVMTGNGYLPQVIQALQRLSYLWCVAVYLKGPATIARTGTPYNFSNHWKPILIYTKGAPAGGLADDTVVSDAPEKSLHPWQQNLGVFEELIRRFTLPGEVVLDPFLGAGTTGIAALRLRRQFLGIDIDAAAVQQSQQRLESLLAFDAVQSLQGEESLPEAQGMESPANEGGGNA